MESEPVLELEGRMAYGDVQFYVGGNANLSLELDPDAVKLSDEWRRSLYGRRVRVTVERVDG